LEYIRLGGVESDDFLVDGNGSNHEPSLRQLVGHDAVLPDRLLPTSRQDHRIGVTEAYLGVLGILLEKRFEPAQSLFVIPLLKTGLDRFERILRFFQKRHQDNLMFVFPGIVSQSRFRFAPLGR
jgi:hypothetical protein